MITAVLALGPESRPKFKKAQSGWVLIMCIRDSGLIILGTNAEAFLLTREERKTLIATARQAIGPDFPIMACCGAHTKKVLELISDAKDAGANSVLVLPPGYFGKATTPEVIERVYNGVDLPSAKITKLSNKHENIVGTKLTYGSMAKIT
ncbi:dihydrodipicolinate synthetase [Seiridium cupressi]